MNTKDELDPHSMAGFCFLVSCFIGGLMVCVWKGTFEDEGFFWSLIGGFIIAMPIWFISVIAAGVFLQVEQYCKREELSDTARNIVLFSCFSMIVILLTFFAQEFFPFISNTN